MAKLKTAVEIALEKAGTISLSHNPGAVLPAPATPQKNTVGVGGVRTGYTILGHVIDGNGFITQEPLVLDDSERCNGMIIRGETGAGKTSFMLSMFLQDIEHGHGGCYMTVDADAINDLIARMPSSRIRDIVLLNPGNYNFPFCINPLPTKNLKRVFERIWDIGANTPQLENILRNCIYTLQYAQGATLAEIPDLLWNSIFRDDVLRQYVPDTGSGQGHWLHKFWTHDFDKIPVREQLNRRNSTLNKVLAFLVEEGMENIIGHTTTIDFSKLVNERKIILVLLQTDVIGQDAARLVGALLLSELLMAALSRWRIPKANRQFFPCFFDEFWLYATADFETLVTQVRRYNVAVHLAHQSLSQLDNRLLGAVAQMNHTVTLRISAPDAKTLSSEHALPPEPEEIPHTVPADILNYLDRSESIEVQSFSQMFVDRLRRALGMRTRERLEWGLFIQHYVPVPPEMNFGEGVVEFDEHEALEAWYPLQALMVEAAKNKTINEPLLREVLRLMAPLLRFSNYYYVIYEAKAVWGEKLRQTNQSIDQQEAFLADDRKFVSDYISNTNCSNCLGYFSCCEHDLNLKWACAYSGKLSGIGGFVMDNWHNPPRRDLKYAGYLFLQEEAARHRALKEVDIYGSIVANTYAMYQRRKSEYEQRLQEERVRATWEGTKEEVRNNLGWSRLRFSLSILGFQGWLSVKAGLELLPAMVFWLIPAIVLGCIASLVVPFGFIFFILIWAGLYISHILTWRRAYPENIATRSNLEELVFKARDRVHDLECSLITLEENLTLDLAKIQKDEAEIRYLTTRLIYDLDTPEKLLAGKKAIYRQKILQPLLEERGKLVSFLATYSQSIEGPVEEIRRRLVVQKYRYESERREAAMRDPEWKEKALSVFYTGKEAHDRFKDSLMAALIALTQKPILVPSAEYRRQITVPPSSEEMRAAMERDLMYLPDGRAWVKLKTDVQGSQVTSLPKSRKMLAKLPPGAVSVAVLQQRLEHIELQNINDGYILPRAQVEQAIQARRAQLFGLGLPQTMSTVDEAQTQNTTRRRG